VTGEVAVWRERVPRLVAECAARWELSVGAPLAAGGFSFVAPVTRRDGTRAVLKLAFPDPESEHEAAALAHWEGAGAVRLLSADAERRALLVERCMPGDQLWSVADEEEANGAAAALLRRLWRPPPEHHDFRSLEGEARRWAVELPARFERHGRPFERALLDRAVSWIGDLHASAPAGDVAVLHQDLHGGNVLRAAHGRWRAIDPKPLVGERAFDVASLLRDRRPELARDPFPARRIRRRLDQLSAELHLDRERVRRWAVVHALVWGMGEDEWFPELLVCAAWLAEA
jgi:streptomycin 6-kinase